MTRPVGRHLIPVLLLAALMLSGRLARAQEESIYLDYRAGPGCPSRAEFERQVRARTARARFAEEPGGVRRFVVEAHAEEGRVVGRLTSGRDEHTGKPREVTSADCASVVAALALMTALAVDPHAVTAEAAPTAATASVASTATMPASEPASLPPRSVAQPARATPPVRKPRARPAPPRDEEPALGSILVGARAGGMLWLDSLVVPVGTLSASLEWQAEGPRLWAPSVRLSANYGASPTVHPAFGAARFRLASGTLDACPLRLALGSSTSVRPCLGLEGGSVSARGMQEAPITHPSEASRPWWAVHEAIRLQFEAGRDWRVEVQGGVIEPLSGYKFVFRTPDVTILRIPKVAPLLSAGVALRFQ